MYASRNMAIFMGIVLLITGVIYHCVMDEYIYRPYNVSDCMFTVMSIPLIFCTMFGMYLIFIHDDYDTHPMT
jgi:hypothetical protein